MLRISKIKIKNFKSIGERELVFDTEFSNIFLGENNVGKTNILMAIEYCLTRKMGYSKELFYNMDLNNEVVISILLQNYNNENEIIDIDPNWYNIFGDKVLPYEDKDSVAIRTIIKYDSNLDKFNCNREIVSNFDDDTSSGVSIPSAFFSSFEVFFVKSFEDISTDIKNNNSIFNKIIKIIKSDINGEIYSRINTKLKESNDLIKDASTKFSQFENDLKSVGAIMEKDNDISIYPFPTEFDDIKNSIKLIVSYNHGVALPVENYGDGIKGWLQMLSLLSYIKLQTIYMRGKNVAYSAIILVEEPEKNMHPNAQRKILNQLQKNDSQIFVTTHSPNIIADFDINNLYYVRNEELCTNLFQVSIPDMKEEDMLKLKSIIIRTNAVIFFAKKVILVEGPTEENLFPGLYSKLNGIYPHDFGVSILGVDGWETFPVYIRFLQALDIEYMIYCDKDAENKFKEKNPDEVNVIFSDGLDMEETIYNNYESKLLEHNDEGFLKVFDTIKVFENEKHLEDLIKKNKLDSRKKAKIKSYMKNNKRIYPFYILKNYEFLSEKELPNSIQSVFNFITGERGE